MTEQQLPEGWQMVKFGDIAKHISKRVEPSETDLEIYVGLEHLDPDSLKIKRHGTPSDVEGQKLLVKKGQIIFGKRRAYQRKVAVADWDCICSAHAMVLEANQNNVIPEFLPFFMQSDVFMNRAVAISEGSLSPTIKWKVLERQLFIFPEKVKQEQLLEELKKAEKVTAISDALIVQLKKTIGCMYQEVFCSKLGVNDFSKYPIKIKANVDVVPLKNLLVCKPQNGLFVKKDVEQEVKSLFLNVVDGYVNSYSNTDNREYVTCSLSDLKKFNLKSGDVLFNRSSLVRSGIGWPFLVRQEDNTATFDCHLIRVKLNKEKILPEYLYIYSLSPWARKYFLCVSQTTTMTTISQSEIDYFPVPVPSLKVQKEIADIFSKLFYLQDQMTNYKQSVLKLINQYICETLEG